MAHKICKNDSSATGPPIPICAYHWGVSMSCFPSTQQEIMTIKSEASYTDERVLSDNIVEM